MVSTNRYLQEPIEIFSWTILTPTIAIKKLDRTAFLHNETGIPKEIRSFLGISHMTKKEQKEVVLTFENQKYKARFEMDKRNSPRSKLIWKSDFASILEDRLPEWYNIFAYNREVPENHPEMKLTKNGILTDEFQVDLIYTDRIESDINNELTFDLESNSGGALEGNLGYIYSNKYERNLENRKKAIEIHGATCLICGFNFERVYGDRGRGFIEIHHIKPLYTLKQEVVINPETDLIPVCSNCHKMIHRKKDDIFSIDDMKKTLNKFL